jgi:nucleotide-binding universal stress UspA family protein
MLRIHNILFPTDFSECAEGAFAHAATLALAHQARLHVLHVVSVGLEEDPDNPLPYFPLEEQVLREAALQDQLTAALEVRRQDGLEMIPAQVTGATPETAILDYAAEQAVDVVVMGTHGRRGVEHFVLGSVAEKVVRLAPCPVLTVRVGTQPTTPPTWQRLLVPLDGSDFSLLALDYAQELAREHGSHLDLLHVIQFEEMKRYEGQAVHWTYADIERLAATSLQNWVASRLEAHRPHTLHLAFGEPEAAIVSFAQEHQSDLIVLATHGRTGLAHLRMGSVAEHVVRLAPCAVWTVRETGRSLIEPASQTPEPAVTT